MTHFLEKCNILFCFYIFDLSRFAADKIHHSRKCELQINCAADFNNNKKSFAPE